MTLTSARVFDRVQSPSSLTSVSVTSFGSNESSSAKASGARSVVSNGSLQKDFFSEGIPIKCLPIRMISACTWCDKLVLAQFPSAIVGIA